MRNLMTLAVQNLYHDPQGGVLGTTEGICMLIGLAIFFLFWFVATDGDMGTHEDTGRPVKSFNTREGKRAAQRRRYHENK